MSALSQFRASDEYKSFSEAKKELFEQKIRDEAARKDARTMSESVIGAGDIARVKGKLVDVK